MALEYLGRGPVEFSPDDHIVLATVRNEALRLPYFLEIGRAHV